MTTPQTVNVGLLERMLSLYFDEIDVAVRVPGGKVYAVTGATLKNTGAEHRLIFELLTEKDLDTRKVVAQELLDPVSRDFFQP